MIMNLYWSLPSILFISALFCFVSNRKHLLSMLLNLEYMVLIIFFLFIIYLSMMNYETYFSMMFLTLSVCEGALGLSILVSMIRTHGNDYFQSFSIM